MITSYLSGRIRIRHKSLKNAENLKDALESIHLQDGIKKVTENIRTGSILIEYDPSILSRDILKSAMTALQKKLDKEEGKERLAPSVSCINENTLLYATYAGTMVSLFASRRLHVLFGGVFAVLSLLHMTGKRKMLTVRKKK